MIIMKIYSIEVFNQKNNLELGQIKAYLIMIKKRRLIKEEKEYNR